MTSAYRDIEKQTKMLADWLATAEEDEASGIPRGPKPATPGSSYHNYGLAFDFNAWTKSGAHFSTSTSKASWEASGIPTIGKSLGLRWGGDFSNNYDPIHFDAKGVGGMPSTTTLSSKAKSQGVEGNQVTV